MGKNVMSETSTIWDVLSVGNTYKIPHNQRSYTWNLENWETLWDSFFSKEERSTYLGTLILLDEDEDFIEIFDGQQRLTTITILIKAFIDYFHEAGLVAKSENLRAFLIVDPDENPRLNVASSLKDYFTQNIQNDSGCKPNPGVSIDEKNIFKAYTYFTTQIGNYFIQEKGENSDFSLEDFFKSLKQRLKNIEIVKLTISDVLLGIEIYESVNATGQQLNDSELTKNILVKHAKLTGALNTAKVDSDWLEVNSRLNALQVPFIDFLHYFWIAKYNYVGKKSIFNGPKGSMKDVFKNDSNRWLELFEDLQKSSETFENIFTLDSASSFIAQYPKANSNPKYSDLYIRYLRCLRFVKNKSWVLPILNLLDLEKYLNSLNSTYIGNKKFHKLLKKHWVFSFVHFNMLSLPTRDFTPAMYKLAQKINKLRVDYPQQPNEIISGINDAFNNHFTNADEYVQTARKRFLTLKDEFLEGVHKLRHRHENKYLFHVIFAEIEEEFYDGTAHHFESHSIEHYMPQESATSWGIKKTVSKLHENKLGNILIIPADVNGSLQNGSHEQKMTQLLEVGNHNKLSHVVKEFLEINKNRTGPYDFSLIDETQLRNSNYSTNPSEIDKRTTDLGEKLWELLVSRMNY